MAEATIFNEENQILQLVVESPGKWNLSALSKETGIPTTTLRYRVGHLRASGHFVRFTHRLTATDEGRVAYYKRVSSKKPRK